MVIKTDSGCREFHERFFTIGVWAPDGVPTFFNTKRKKNDKQNT